MKPLFVPLKTEHYEGFASGRKTAEYRLYGPRWNDKTCMPGRDVTLSKGYGKKNRMTGVVDGIQIVRVCSLEKPHRSTMLKLYGLDSDDEFAIAIHIKDIKPVLKP